LTSRLALGEGVWPRAPRASSLYRAHLEPLDHRGVDLSGAAIAPAGRGLPVIRPIGRFSPGAPAAASRSWQPPWRAAFCKDADASPPPPPGPFDLGGAPRPPQPRRAAGLRNLAAPRAFACGLGAKLLPGARVTCPWSSLPAGPGPCSNLPQ